ncbi:MAG: hypothetical protein IMHGJWDQ_002294 [Candidatus Fervidibacter sp.]
MGKGKKKHKHTVALFVRDPRLALKLREALESIPEITLCNPPRHDADAVIVELPLLTPAERETLQALAQLGSYSQVAKATNCSITTVKRRLAQIYEKLKVKSVPQAVAIAICYGLISLSR